MKTLLRIGLPIIICLFIFLGLIAGILPTKIEFTPQSVEEIVYSEATQLAISQYERTLALVQETKGTEAMAELAFENAQNERKAAEKAACMSQYLAAQAKWQDTPAYMETELSRLRDSMEQANKCAF